jgi:hypothetical protein
MCSQSALPDCLLLSLLVYCRWHPTASPSTSWASASPRSRSPPGSPRVSTVACVPACLIEMPRRCSDYIDVVPAPLLCRVMKTVRCFSVATGLRVSMSFAQARWCPARCPGSSPRPPRSSTPPRSWPPPTSCSVREAVSCYLCALSSAYVALANHLGVDSARACSECSYW